MKIAVAATSGSLEADVSPNFGRCPAFVIVDSESLEFEAFDNPAREMSGGAGPAAVQEIANHGAEMVLAGQFGPKALQALRKAGIRQMEATGTVRDAVTGLKP